MEDTHTAWRVHVQYKLMGWPEDIPHYYFWRCTVGHTLNYKCQVFQTLWMRHDISYFRGVYFVTATLLCLFLLMYLENVLITGLPDRSLIMFPFHWKVFFSIKSHNFWHKTHRQYSFGLVNSRGLENNWIAGVYWWSHREIKRQAIKSIILYSSTRLCYYLGRPLSVLLAELYGLYNTDM